MRSKEGIHVEQVDGSLCLSWDNRATHKKPFLGVALVAWWIAWTPLTLLLTRGTFGARGFYLVMCVFALSFVWVFELMIPYILLSRRWRESLILDKNGITLSYSGLFARKPRIMPLETVREIRLTPAGAGEDRSSIATLNIDLSEAVPFWSRRQMVGYWLSYELQLQLFHAIEAFIEMHDLGIQCTQE